MRMCKPSISKISPKFDSVCKIKRDNLRCTITHLIK